MYEFWYGYVKIKYQDKAGLCYMDTDSFVVNIKTKDFYKDISQDANKRFDTSNYTFDRPLPTGINKKVIGLMKDELDDYKKCLFDNEKVLKSQQRFKSENHDVYTENINKIALSCDDDKRIVTSDRITSYPYGYVLKN